MLDLQVNILNIFAFSDTHGRHRELQVPENVDIVICAGDAVEDNLVGDEYDDFIEWFASLSCKWKIFVPGNHELSFELGQADGIIQHDALIDEQCAGSNHQQHQNPPVTVDVIGHPEQEKCREQTL